MSRSCRDPANFRDTAPNSAPHPPLPPGVHKITNINEDGTIPAVEATNWTNPDFNNYRQNKQPDSVFAAPDAIVALLFPKCTGDFELVALVRNLGTAVLPPGAEVTFYKGVMPDGVEIGKATTKLALYPAQAEQVSLFIGDMEPDIKDGLAPIYAVVSTQAIECRTDNNTSSPEYGACIPPG